MNGKWVEPDVRDEIVCYVDSISKRTTLTKRELIKWLRIPISRYYDWKRRQNRPNHHNGKIPKSHWILPEEERLIVSYCRGRLIDGYRRETHKMLDEDVAAFSPSNECRVLKEQHQKLDSARAYRMKINQGENAA